MAMISVCQSFLTDIFPLAGIVPHVLVMAFCWKVDHCSVGIRSFDVSKECNLPAGADMGLQIATYSTAIP